MASPQWRGGRREQRLAEEGQLAQLKAPRADYQDKFFFTDTAKER